MRKLASIISIKLGLKAFISDFNTIKILNIKTHLFNLLFL